MPTRIYRIVKYPNETIERITLRRAACKTSNVYQVSEKLKADKNQYFYLSAPVVSFEAEFIVKCKPKENSKIKEQK